MLSANQMNHFDKISNPHRKDSDPLIHQLFKQTLIVMIIAELSTSVATMLDGIIIAHFFDKYAVVAYGLSSPYTSMVKMVGGFFATGTQVVYSQYAARGEAKKANEVFSVSTVVMVTLSLAFAAMLFVFAEPFALLLGASKDVVHLQQYTAEYMRGLAIGLPLNLAVLFLVPLMNIDGDKKRIAYAINVMLVVNLVGDLVVALIFHGGLFGLAFATSVSYLCSIAVLLLHFRKGSSIRLNLRTISMGAFTEVAKSGIIPAVTRSFSMIRAYMINIIFITFAGAEALAANTLVQSNIKAVPVCVAMAIGTSTLSIAGVIYEECDRRGLCQIFHSVLKISFGPCLLITAAIFVFAPQVVGVFGATEVADMTVLALRYFIVGLPFIGVKLFYVYYFQSTRKKAISYYSSVAGECCFLVLSAYLLGRMFGNIGLFICYPVSELFYLISIFMIAWFKQGHFPRSVYDLLFLGSEFDIDAERILDVSINNLKEVSVLSEKAMQFCKENHADSKKAMYIGLVVEEMAGNIFEHGADDNKKHYVDMKIIVFDDVIKLRLRDNCRQFNPKERAEMMTDDLEHNIGIRIVSKISKTMNYTNLFNMNQLTIEI